jgi:hypothetical protein
MHPILLGKVKSWALASNGMFYDEGSHEYRRLEGASTSSQDCKCSMKFAKLKSTVRAIEKVVRSYGQARLFCLIKSFYECRDSDCVVQDVSMLVDLCRQSIVFDKISDIVTCFQIITNDTEAIVIRVKNRLDLSYDSSIPAGYRDVALNVQIINKDTIELGVETHICELQLLLRPFAELEVSIV